MNHFFIEVLTRPTVYPIFASKSLFEKCYKGFFYKTCICIEIIRILYIISRYLF